MKKNCKMLCLILIFLMVLTPVSVIFGSASSVFDRQQKSIYLVLDDSSSMGYEGTNDANYSLQTLLAMTDKNDKVKLYFLNSRVKVGLSGELDMTKKSNKWLSDICGKYPNSNGSTPYEQVKIAQEELKAAVSKDDTTEYWLVIFTDGSFDGVNPDNDLHNFANTTLENGSKPNVLYISAGGRAIQTNDSTPSNLNVISDSNIISAMSQAAKEISGRIEIGNATYSSDKKSITFSLPYPARNIIVLTQNNETKITAQKSSSDIDLSENYTVTYPGGSKFDKSTVCFLTEKSGSSIASGEITLTFDKSVVPDNTTILFEPAIGMTARYFNSDGQEIEPDKLYIGEEFTVKFTLCDSETKQPLDPSIFGGKVSYTSEINGIKEVDKDTRTFTIDNSNLDIKLSATLPDGYVLEETRKYEIQTKRIITFILSNGGKFSADINDVDTAEGINANILINGIPVTADEFSNFKIDVAGTNKFTSNLKIEKDEQNCNYVIHPQKALISTFTPKSKTYKVTLTDELRGDTYTADLIVEITGDRNWLPFIIALIIIAIVIYLIIVFATKTYFPRKLRFLMYVDEPPTFDTMPPCITFKLSQLYWNEFKQCFRGNFTFFKHLVQQLLPNTQACVTLYNVGRVTKKGYFSNITIYASTPTTIQAEDKCITYDDITGKFDSEFSIYSSDFIPAVGADELLNIPNKKPRFSIPLDMVLVKDATDDTSEVYLQITQKRRN